MTNRWKIIFIATVFNVLFEYSLRGVNNLRSQPFLPFILFPIYFTLFTMVEDLIVRFRLKAYQLMILSFFYGTLYVAYTSGLAFIKPAVFGIDVASLMYVNIVWWGAIQAVLTFYLANLLSPRDWNHDRLSVKGWIMNLVINFFFSIFIFQKSGLIPSGTPAGNLSIFIISIITFLVFIKTLQKKGSIRSFKPSKFLTMSSFLTVVVFLIAAVFLVGDPIKSNTPNVNAFSLKIISIYTLAISVLLLGYRIKTEKEIPV